MAIYNGGVTGGHVTLCLGQTDVNCDKPLVSIFTVHSFGTESGELDIDRIVNDNPEREKHSFSGRDKGKGMAGGKSVRLGYR